jgi:hypothetical protein
LVIMTDLVTPRTLAELADQPDANPTILIGGVEAVVLGRTSSGSVAVYRDGVVHDYIGTIPVVTVISADNRLDVLERAVRDLGRWREQSMTTAAELRAVLPRIRAYAVERHQAGDICRDGLNRFFRTFDLPEYEPRLKVTYTITGSFEIADSDKDNARQAVADLRVELPDWTDIDDASADHSAYLDEAELVDPGDDL